MPNAELSSTVEDHAQLRRAVIAKLADATIVIKAAAVADYTPKQVAGQKLKRTTRFNLAEKLAGFSVL